MGGEELQCATVGVGCDGFHSRVSVDMSTENEGRNCEVPRDGGAVWRCGGSGCVFLRWRDDKNGIVLGWMFLMGAMERRNALFGKRCSRSTL